VAALRIAAVVPTYDEAENLPGLVSALFALPLDLSVLVVDDDSPDGTGKVAEGLVHAHPRLTVMHRIGRRGLRSAYLNGIERVLSQGAEAVLQIDADLSHDPWKVVELSDALREADLVLGSRYIPGGSLDDDWPRWRRGLSAFGNLYARSILGIPITDITTGFRLWRAETLRGMPLDRIQSNGYVFLVEMAYMAHCLQYRVKEVPIHFSERQRGVSKMSLGIQIEAAIRVWQVWWLHRDLRRAGRGGRIATPRSDGTYR
jgi:dolichol-phosphate mannosyltransferase